MFPKFRRNWLKNGNAAVFYGKKSFIVVVPNPPTFYGTPEYAAPESFGQEPMLDIWSFGIVLFGMLTGNLPFNTERKKRSRYERLIKKVVGGLTEVHIKKMKSLSPG